MPMVVGGAPLTEAAGAVVVLHGRGGRATDLMDVAGQVAGPRFALVGPEAFHGMWYPHRFTDPDQANEPFLSSAVSVVDDLVSRLVEGGIAVDADTGEIAAAALTTSDVDDASQVGALLDQMDGPASFTADGAYDQDDAYGQVAVRHPEASVIVPPRSSAAPSDTAQTAPTMRDRHLQSIAERGRMAWQKASGNNWRALVEVVEADISRFKRVIGDGLRSHTDRRRATEVAIAVCALNRMPALGRPEYVRIL